MDLDKHVSLNLDVRGIGRSATISIKEECNSLRSDGKRVYDFGLGQSPFPVPTEVVNALKLHAHEKDYLPVTGLPALQEAVAGFHESKDRVHPDPERVLIGPGSKELMFLLQLSFYGEIIIPTPCWVSYAPQAEMLGRKVRFIPTTFEQKWNLTPECLAELMQSERDVYRPRIVILNYPCNPSGLTYSPGKLKEIADVAREYEVILLSDEIYGQLHHKGEHVSVARYYPEGTIISSGLSKWCGAGGWRLGTFTFPRELDWLRDAMASVASETYTSVCAPIQHAAVRAFEGGINIERYLWHSRRILATLGEKCASILREAGVRVRDPEGAFYLFLDLSHLSGDMARRGILDSTGMCERLLRETGVAVLPGVPFGRPAGELSARLSYVDFDGAKALAASETIPLHEKLPDEFLDRWCHNVIRGCTRMAEWVSR